MRVLPLHDRERRRRRRRRRTTCSRNGRSGFGSSTTAARSGCSRAAHAGMRRSASTIGPGCSARRRPGCRLRTGSAIGPAEVDREAAIAALLTVRPAGDGGDGDPDDASLLSGFSGSVAARRRRHYREARLAPGDAVTIIGRAIPFSDLSDPTEADEAVGSGVAAGRPGGRGRHRRGPGGRPPRR